MIATIIAGLGVACLALAAIGCVYALAAVAAVRGFRGDKGQPPATFPGVTILKPLAGAEAELYDDLTSFCDLDYRGPVQILFGVQDGRDAAVGVVERLIAERRGRDLELVVHAARGANPKIANLAALERSIRHEVVILADADIVVGRGYLDETIAALGLPNVGAVTYLYRGVARESIWARLVSMGIDYHFFPGVIVGLKLGLARPCFGSTIALRRETLAAIGGFTRFADHLADDNAIGEAVRACGMKVAIPSMVLAHSCSERSGAEFALHELRWARTVRAVNAAGFAGSVVTHPLPLALLGAALTGFGVLGTAMLAAAIACRLVLQLQVDHTLTVRSNRWWLEPLRDLLAFGVYVATFFVEVVSWRGQRYRVRSDGTMIALREQKP
ncbi:MAG TPA: bacteriohopanetetrol glucosamine biosynthesis glycosyltransferase HpnI [Casimicrobiaceae bacterium]|nr:bacteriohopanetetrol glucosamine biosynthesis glycosyltransferase HpnI [Casimicrobiaceae bacterium]